MAHPVPIEQQLVDLSRLDALAGDLPAFSQAAADAARTHQARLTKPPGSLGRLEELAIWMAGWQDQGRPQCDPARVLIFAGNHGVCAQGVSDWPMDVTAQMVGNFRAGGAAINRICEVAGAHLDVVPLALDRPTCDFSLEPAMSAEECRDAFMTGVKAVPADTALLLLGEMGIGNSSVASALAAALVGGDVSDWVGLGASSSAETVERKRVVIARGVALHAAHARPAVEILAALGGREQAAICGAVIAARAQRIPVLLDGFIATAAAAVLHFVKAGLLDHCLIAHLSAEPGHAALARALGKHPLLDLDMRLGEASGAALALPIMRAAVACHNGMATFDSAGVARS